MEIRLAKKEDFVHVARMRWDFKIEDGDCAKLPRREFEKRCLAKLREESDQWAHFIAFEGDESAGMVSVCRVPKLPSPAWKAESIGYLTNTYVVSGKRNGGIGEQLLKFAIAWAKDNNLELLFVWPSERSKTLYGRLGFQSENEIMELLF